MRLCRFRNKGEVGLGLYGEERVVPLGAAGEAYEKATGEGLGLPESGEMIDFLPPEGKGAAGARKLAEWVQGGGLPEGVAVATSEVELLVPVPRPNKLFLLAGNYAAHIEEGGGIAAERQETFPYVFMKPPTTTLTDPGKAVKVPKISPGAIDWELELGVVIGRRCKAVPENEALGVVAGYTVINDISNRRFRPNANRKAREKDAFFDWLHGKWHDSFCPCGPCVTSADELADPQTLELKLEVNGTLKQDVSTAQMIFPVAAVIEFISSFVTLEPGDIISTGTGPGVGAAKEDFLHAGDVIRASISGIGTLESPVEAE